MPYVLALDSGTTSCRAVLFDEAGNVKGIAQREFRQSYPQPGWVEHDPNEIWMTQRDVARQVLVENRLLATDIAGIGITNQRETTVVWDRKTGEPICPAIVWQDRRTSDDCNRLRNQGLSEFIGKRTGLVLDAYFSATKIAWILNQVPGARARSNAGELAFGTIDSWLIWKLTNGSNHVTDHTNASRTLLYNLNDQNWDDELLQLFDVPRSLLPQIVEPSGVCAETSADVFGSSILIAGIAGDQQAALFGQRCFKPGTAKTTYGTGCFMLMHTGDRPRLSRHQLISTVAAAGPNQTAYALEGSVFIGGAVVQWLRDGLGIIEQSGQVRELAGSVPDCGGVTFVPAFAGLGAPYWDQQARGMLIGITRGTTAGHIARAAVESIAHQVADLVDAMEQDHGERLTEMRVDGGATCDDLLMQFQADLLNVPLIRPKLTEITALGAALLAGLAVGVWKDIDSLTKLQFEESRFEPNANLTAVRNSREQWKRAVERCRNWAD
jgi:glycerol kinase